MLSKPNQSVAAKLNPKDMTIVCLVLTFTFIALTLELYWLIFHQTMESRTDLFAQAWALYWPADWTFRMPGYSVAKAFTLAVTIQDTLITPWLNGLLIWGIFKRRPYRYALQLVIATYTTYGTILYYGVAHISDYAVFEQKTTGTYLQFYLTNFPWLAFYGWLGWDAFRALLHAERT